jgi:hypothetical protein
MSTYEDGKDDEKDGLLSELGALPAPPADPGAAARTHRRARAAFLRHARLRERPWLVAIGRLYFRAEPALAASVVVLYLGWAIQTVIALKR